MELDFERWIIVMVGVPGSGKSTLVGRLFRPSQVVSLDTFREMVTDDRGSQAANHLVVPLARQLLVARCQMGRLSVIDATNVQPEHREPLLRVADKYGYRTAALVLDTPLDICQARDEARPETQPEDGGPVQVGREKIAKMWRDLYRAVPESGPVPGFTMTRRITPGGDQMFSTVAGYADAPWMR